MVKLSIKSSVICSQTAFVAVDDESQPPITGPLKTYDLLMEEFEFGMDSFAMASFGRFIEFSTIKHHGGIVYEHSDIHSCCMDRSSYTCLFYMQHSISCEHAKCLQSVFSTDVTWYPLR